MRISDWSSDVCSSDLQDRSLFPCIEGSGGQGDRDGTRAGCRQRAAAMAYRLLIEIRATDARGEVVLHIEASLQLDAQAEPQHGSKAAGRCPALVGPRSEEHTSELQSLMRISYAVFCLKKKNKKQGSKMTDNRKPSKNAVK